MTHQLPLVSIITVCLNADKTIRRTIESVITQSYGNVEYIIIDGASTDHTLDIINEYRSHIRYLVTEKDEGISDAFNKGINGSNGEYIQLLNADDYMPSDKIELSVNLFTQYRDAAFVFGDMIVIDLNGKPLFRLHGDENYASAITRMMPVYNHPTIMVRRRVYDEHGFYDTSLKIAMDYEWFFRIHKAGEYGVYSPDILVYFQEGGCSSNCQKGMMEKRTVAINNGVNRAQAYLFYGLYSLRRVLGLLLDKIFPARVVMLFRSRKTYLRIIV